VELSTKRNRSSTVVIVGGAVGIEAPPLSEVSCVRSAAGWRRAGDELVALLKIPAGAH
jgi:hypothetical protein